MNDGPASVPVENEEGRVSVHLVLDAVVAHLPERWGRRREGGVEEMVTRGGGQRRKS